MIIIKDQSLVVNTQPFIRFFYHILLDVPGSDTSPQMLDFPDAFEPVRPIVQGYLTRDVEGFVLCVLEAAISPVLQDLGRVQPFVHRIVDPFVLFAQPIGDPVIISLQDIDRPIGGAAVPRRCIRYSGNPAQVCS